MSDADSMYWQNELDAFAVGAQMDLRARIALDMLKSSPMLTHLGNASFERQDDTTVQPTPKNIVAFAMDIADEFVAECAELGWIKPITEQTELSAPLRKHAERQGAYQVSQQIGAQRASTDASRVATLAQPSNPFGRA